MQFEQAYDATGKKGREFEPLPAGEYTVMITETEEKQNGPNSKDPSGSQLVLKMQIVEGHYKDRILFDRLNLNNVSEQTRDIAYKTLNEILMALEPVRGSLKIENSSEIQAIPLNVKIRVKAADGNFPAGNVIDKYLPYRALGAESQASPTGQAPAQGAPPATVTDTRPAWEREPVPEAAVSA